MPLQFQNSLKLFGIILFILIIPLMWLSGEVAFADDDEVAPKPVTSSETASESSSQTARSLSEVNISSEIEANTYIFIPFVAKPLKNDPSTYMNDLELGVLDLVNIERAKAGCGPVEGESHLQDAAFRQSKDMANNQGNSISHTGSDGSRFWDRADDAGYAGFAAGENIAAGYSTAQSVMSAWMNSPGHRSNILNCSHTHLGVGYHYSGSSYYRHYWTQVFGRE